MDGAGDKGFQMEIAQQAAGNVLTFFMWQPAINIDDGSAVSDLHVSNFRMQNVKFVTKVTFSSLIS